MENSLKYLADDLFLRQSELFGDAYKNIDTQIIHTFNELSVSNLEDWQNSVIQKYLLNNLQIENFQIFLFSLSKILETINPDKLKIKDEFIENESEFLLWRESSKGISKLSFDKFGEITYVFNGNDGRKVRGVFDRNVDFEKLLYKFLSL